MSARIVSLFSAVLLACAGDAPSDIGPERAAWLVEAQQHIALREYRASENGAGLQAPNRAQNLRTWFDSEGIRVHDRTAAGSPELLRLSLAGIGRGEALSPVPSGEEVAAEDNRVEIRRPGLVEWYVNSKAGLEQGFTLDARPEGEGALVLDLAVKRAEARLSGDAVRLDTGAGRALRYGKLFAWDAEGAPLAAHFEVPAPDRVQLVVADAGAAYPLTIDPLLTEAADAVLESSQADARLGWSVASAGDVNGDGYADVIVGAPQYDAGAPNEGAAFVFLGSAAGIGDGDPVNAHAQLESDQAHAQLGYSVSTAGDVNGDGYADVIVGAVVFDSGETDEGAAFVFLGSAAGIGDGNPANAHAQLESDQAGAQLGFSVSSAGDVNGDGYADVIVGARFYSAGEQFEGAAFVFLGSAAGIGDGDPASAHAQLESDQDVAQFGFSVSSAGDVNGDGYADVIVGAPPYDAAFVFLGSAAGIADGSPATAHAQLNSGQVGAQLGYSVASAGDVNGDGYADVIAGARFYDAGEADEGAAFVFLGSAAGIGDGSPATAHAQLESDQAGAWLGWSVASAGDVNGDGYADVLVGAPQYDAGETDEGAAFVFLGSASGMADADPSGAYAQLESDQAATELGYSVATAGDVNGDGYPDLIVGSPTYDNGELKEGAAFVFLGGASGIPDGSPTTAHTRVESGQPSALLGRSVASAGDVNGDGHSDVVVGAPFFDAGEFDEGAAFVFLGSASGIGDGSPATAHAQLESDQALAWLGWSVSSSGDVNGDGYADVIVGAPQYDAGETDEGAAFVFLGSASGIADADPATAHARLTSDQAGALLGWSAASAGDVNGDGYSDVVLGARHYDAGETDEGAAFVFLGSASGIGDGSPATAHARLESDQAGAQLGFGVASAGDVDGDGYGDVVVGATFYDAGESDEGAAFVFLGGASGIGDGSPATAHAQLESDQAGAQLGFGVASAGDVNGDGYADVIVGAPQYDAGETDEGAAFVFLGSASGIGDGSPATAHARLESDQASSRFGWSVSSAGDVNGDGYADVIAGALQYDAGQFDEGAAFVFLGSASGIGDGSPATAHAQLESDQVNAQLGFSVSSAGDVNGDGYADVIVGALSYDVDQPNEGAAFVFLGNAEGRPVQARQLRGDGSGIAVGPWGSTFDADGFTVTILGSHPEGTGRVRALVEACGPGVPFGDPGCPLDVTPSWVEVDGDTPQVQLSHTFTGLAPGTLYRWRARVLYAPSMGSVPMEPPHGPWRRYQAQTVEADVRVMPEPGALGIAFALLALAGLRWIRMRRTSR